MGPIGRLYNAISALIVGVILIVVGIIILPNDTGTGAFFLIFGLLCMVPGLVILLLTVKVIRLARGAGGNRNTRSHDLREEVQSDNIHGNLGGQQQAQGGQSFCQNCGQSRHARQQFCGGCGGQ